MSRLIVVSNRVSPPSERASRAGGLAIAMREALRKQGGVWFGWSGRCADAPADTPEIVEIGKITFATVDLSRRDHAEYYVGYANGSLWPLFHYQLGLFAFHRPELEGYLRVNARFARILLPMLRPDDLVWVHDYHLLPLAEELRRLGVGNRMGFFLHTPFPTTEVFTALPEHEVLFRGLCAYDLIGLQTENDLRALGDYVINEAGGEFRSDGGVTALGRRTRACCFPIGIDTERFAAMSESAALSPETRRLEDSLQGRALIIGVDRLDYSKGLGHRFDAVEALLTNHPEHRSRVTFLQITPTSRTDVAQYREIRRQLERAAGRINGRFADFDWMPVRYLNKSFPRTTLAGFYRVAHVGLVTPLRDGMNLVAKEFVAAQDPDDPGVLVLSRFAGAARELGGAVTVNPFDADGVGLALHRSLQMPLAERQARWREMMAVLQRNTISAWQDSFIAALRKVRRQPLVVRA